MLSFNLRIKLEDRNNELWEYDATLYVDGVDFLIEEPEKDDPWWYSHKHNGPGLQYKVATLLQTGLICWTSGPWRAGLWNGKAIFRNGLYFQLEDNHPVYADRRYSNTADKNGQLVFITPNVPGVYEELQASNSRAHLRHEGVNGSIKKCAVLENQF